MSKKVEETAETAENKTQTTEEKQEKKSEQKTTVKSKKDELNEQIATLKKQADDYKDKWLRNVAEFDNYKKRNANIWADAFNEGAFDVIGKILPVGDNLDWALTLELDEKTKEGIKNIRKKFDDTLTSLGVEEINPVGEQFDPNIAEAVMQVAGDEGEESDTVKMVFEKGYKKKDKIIRYAKVSVVK